MFLIVRESHHSNLDFCASMEPARVLIIDNFDSFTFNLFHLVEKGGGGAALVRNDELDRISLDDYTHMIIGPGPGLPTEIAHLQDSLMHWEDRPLLGVCLGFQFMLTLDSVQLVNLLPVRHGVLSRIQVVGDSTLYKSIPKAFSAGLYHSWGVMEYTGSDYQITAYDQQDVIMSLEHKVKPWFGVQYHPESIMTEHGDLLMKNFLETKEKTKSQFLQ